MSNFFILQNISSNLFILYHCGGTIIHNTNNNIIYIGGSIVFLNGIRGMSFEDTKKVI